MAARRWRLKWPTVYPIIGIVILWHQTFVAESAQPWLVMPALLLLGLQIPINYARALTALAVSTERAAADERDGRDDVDR